MRSSPRPFQTTSVSSRTSALLRSTASALFATVLEGMAAQPDSTSVAAEHRTARRLLIENSSRSLAPLQAKSLLTHRDPLCQCAVERPASPAAGSVSAAHAGGSQVQALVGRHSWCRTLPTIVHPRNLP